MRKLLFFLFLTLLCGSVWSQNKREQLDLANDFLLKAEKSRHDTDTAHLYFKKSLDLYIKVNDSNALANYYSKRGVYYLRHLLGNEAIKVFKEGLPYLESRTSDTLIGKLYGDLVYSNTMVGKLDTALQFGEIGVRRTKQIGHKKGEAFIYYALAQPLISLGLIDSSIICLSKAIDYYRSVGNIQREVNCISRTAACYKSLGQNEKALEALLFTLELCKKHKLDEEWYVRHRVGAVYLDLEKFELAEKFLKESLTHPELVHRGNLITAKLILGEVYLRSKRPKKALPLIKESYDFFREEGNVINILASAIALMETHTALKNYDNTIAIAKEVEKLEGFDTHITNQVMFYHELTEAYKGKGDYKNAFEYIELSNALDDSIKRQVFQEELAAAETELNTKLKEKEIGLLKLDKENLQKKQEISDLKSARQSYLIYGLIGVLTAIVILAWLIISRKQKALMLIQKEKELKEKEKELEAQRSLHMRLKALRAQLNPHFIFNSLASVQSFMLKNEVNKTIEYIGAFARLMRNTLENSEETFIPLEDELAVLKDYVMLEQIRLSGGFEFDCEVEEGLEFDAMVPTMLIQPYLENAIWHGLSNKLEGEKRLLLSFTSSEDVMKCVVEDNGAGREFTKEKARDHKSHSMRINQARLDLLNSLEGNIAKVEIEDKYEGTNPTGTRVIITLPLEL